MTDAPEQPEPLATGWDYVAENVVRLVQPPIYARIRHTKECTYVDLIAIPVGRFHSPRELEKAPILATARVPVSGRPHTEDWDTTAEGLIREYFDQLGGVLSRALETHRSCEALRKSEAKRLEELHRSMKKDFEGKKKKR